ncbi:hypothetical protein [Enterococcus rivorum]|uniref:Uncharacterized protein n=2 Tax=Enterococcus rivorum TaxID=762845 RepID=A0A1E5L0K9_9ENTE|nr:hypothetical protein [Enterococcus rivorum]MBP2098900.1 myosin heavy subunit [Enterococcus rivorum]OEH83625.1 hypothetical protein BCR26_09110 [Enterococcus rivorum]
MTKRQKIVILVLITIVLVAGVGGTVYASQVHKQVEEAEETVKAERVSVEKVTKELSKLLDQKDPSYLAENVTEEQIASLDQQLKQSEFVFQDVSVDKKLLKDHVVAYESAQEKADKLIGSIYEKITLQRGVNTLFQSKDKVAMNGAKVEKELAIIDGLTEEKIKSIQESIPKEETDFTKDVKGLVENASGQLKQISTAKEAVAKLYKGNKVVSTDQKLYDAAKAETDKIKNEKTKKELTDQLGKVKAELDKKAKEVAVAQAQETATKEQTAQTETTGNVNANVEINDAGSTQGNNATDTDTGSWQQESTNTGGTSNWQQPTTGGGGGNTNTNTGGGGGSGSNTGGGGGGTVTPPPTTAPTIVSGYIGNSGMIFSSGLEANLYGNSVLASDPSKNGYVLIGIFYSDGSEKFSIDFY